MLPPNQQGQGSSAAFCRKPLRCAGVAADGNPPPTFYAAGVRRWRHSFPDFRAPWEFALKPSFSGTI
jgi:hypothetical protein